MCQSRLASANTDDLKLSIRSSLLLPPRALVYSSNVILFFSVKRAEVIKQLCEHDTTHQEYLLCVYTAPTSSKKIISAERNSTFLSILCWLFPPSSCRVVVACSHGWKIHQKLLHSFFLFTFTPDALHPSASSPSRPPGKSIEFHSLHCKKKSHSGTEKSGARESSENFP